MISNFDFQFNSYFILIQAQRLGYQLKSQKSRIGDSITDGAYAAMMNAIRHDETPNFYFNPAKTEMG